ncbi:MAG TPA: SDR family oxidoreductase [Longimicrobiales bacterium]
MASREMRGLAGLERERDDLSGKSVLVTGGSMGIGLACAEEALAAGARVMIAARGREALDAAAAGLAARHGADRVHAAVADVGVEKEVDALVAAAVERMGGIDGVVHAAAVIGPIGPVLETDAAAWLDAVRVDLWGAFLVARAVGRVMRARGGGRMVLLSGGGATSPFPNYSAYACSKVGVVRLVETLAAELAGAGIEVNALAPGFVATRIHDATLEAGARAGAEYLARTRRELETGGVPAALAGRAAVFLLSDRAAGITGKLVAAPWDEWWTWPERREAVAGSDLFTLRRIVPSDRGLAWS